MFLDCICDTDGKWVIVNLHSGYRSDCKESWIAVSDTAEGAWALAAEKLARRIGELRDMATVA
jgi:hypothetical protein